LDGELVNETDAVNNTTHRHVFFAGHRVCRADTQPTWSAHFYFSDQLGSANVVTNATGSIEEESDYYPYGGERVITNILPQNYKFAGKERDTESGLDSFGARYNASALGRFMTVDPYSV
jgi:RHS repeat-associated protein